MIIVDTEASGTDVFKHALLSIGAIDFDHPDNRFYGECKIWDGAHIMDEALAVNGFTKAEITDSKKQTDGELVKAFIDWSMSVKDKTCAGQNPSFDRDFMQRAAMRSHINWPFAYRTIDMHTLCYMHMVKRGIVPPTKEGKSDLNSEKVMVYVGIPKEKKPHNALNCALTAAEAISRLLYDKKLLLEYEAYPIPWIKAKKRAKKA